MRVLVTGSAGHLGEALVRVLRDAGHEVVGLDVLPSPFTTAVGSIADRGHVRRSLAGVEAVLHTATLHKPHLVTHTRRQFVETNITGTRNLLEESAAAGVGCFVFTSTTSVFGHALVPPADAPAGWLTEDVTPAPKNVYGATKLAAEDLCQRFHREHGLPCLVLRTSRFFLEEDDDEQNRRSYRDDNLKLNEYLYRRVEIEDAVGAHQRALERAPALGFGRFVISATTPFARSDRAELRRSAPLVVERRVPGYDEEYARRGWKMFPGIDRVYANDRARRDLRWRPRHDFASMLARTRDGEEPRSALARAVGSKGYHARRFAKGPYPVA